MTDGRLGPLWLGLAIVMGFLLLARGPLARRRVDLTFLAWLGWPLRVLAFRIRRALALRRGAPTLRSAPNAPLFDHLAGSRRERALAREAELRARYDLGALREAVDAATYRENLYFLDLLDRLATPHLPRAEALRAIDVGSQDFRYATALERWLAHAGAPSPRRVTLDGIELDGHVLYRDLRARVDWAEAHARVTGNPAVRYRVEDFLATKERGLDVVFVWFPFVVRYALVQWGLPASAFAPERLFARAIDALRPGGLLVVVTHTHEERDALGGLLRALPGLDPLVGPLDAASDLPAYAELVPERTMTLARRST
jgi:SAM-dependent methyltransferase